MINNDLELNASDKMNFTSWLRIMHQSTSIVGGSIDR